MRAAPAAGPPRAARLRESGARFRTRRETGIPRRDAPRRHRAGRWIGRAPPTLSSSSFLTRGASPLGLPYTRSRPPLRRRAPIAWLASLRSLAVHRLFAECSVAHSFLIHAAIASATFGLTVVDP